MIVPWKNEKVRMVYQRPEIKASVEIILSVFTVVTLLLIAVRPTLGIVATLQKKIDDQAVVDKKLSNKIAQLIKATDDLSTYAADLGAFNLAVTDGGFQSGLAKRIELLAITEGIEIKALSFEPVPLLGETVNLADKAKERKPISIKDTDIAEYGISFEISGSQDQLFSCLEKIENLDRVVIVKNVGFKKEIGRDEKGGIINSIHLSGRAMAYYVL